MYYIIICTKGIEFFFIVDDNVVNAFKHAYLKLCE